MRIIQKQYPTEKTSFLHVAHFINTNKIFLAPYSKIDRLFLGCFSIGVWKIKSKNN